MGNLSKPVITEELSELSKKAYSYLFEQSLLPRQSFRVGSSYNTPLAL